MADMAIGTQPTKELLRIKNARVIAQVISTMFLSKTKYKPFDDCCPFPAPSDLYYNLE